MARPSIKTKAQALMAGRALLARTVPDMKLSEDDLRLCATTLQRDEGFCLSLAKVAARTAKQGNPRDSTQTESSTPSAAELLDAMTRIRSAIAKERARSSNSTTGLTDWKTKLSGSFESGSKR